MRGRPGRVTVAGHADRSGAGALQRRAVRAPRATTSPEPWCSAACREPALEVEWFGERRPRIPTPDGSASRATGGSRSFSADREACAPVSRR